MNMRSPEIAAGWERGDIDAAFIRGLVLGKIRGNGKVISVATVLVLLAFSFLVSNMGRVKPLFLPTPQAVFQLFVEYLTGTANDKPLWQHFAARVVRVLGLHLGLLPDGQSDRHRDGHEPRDARHLRPDVGVLPPAAVGVARTP